MGPLSSTRQVQKRQGREPGMREGVSAEMPNWWLGVGGVREKGSRRKIIKVGKALPG